MLLTIAFSARTAHAQDSPIYVNDNGNVPFENQGQKGKSTTKNKSPKAVRTVQPTNQETHINYVGGIQYSGTEYFIEGKKYQAVCLEKPDGTKISLATVAPWRLTTLSRDDNAVIGGNGDDNNHIHIDPGKTMGYRPPNDMDDPDDPAHGKKNQMTGAVFITGLTNQSIPYSSPTHSIIIHYCGPAGCVDPKGVDQCADAPKRSQKQ
jgi:hypothetical protein